MAMTAEALEKCIDGIVTELAEYFELRYDMITRVKPSLASMHDDLLWLQMEKVRDVLRGQKMFGPERWKVGEILASRDESKRAAVMGPIDQSSILNELVPEQEETDTRRPGFVAVRNMKALYTSVDPSLGPVIELSDVWLWWDILDAADVVNFKRQKKRLDRLQNAELTTELQGKYHEMMGVRDDREVSREEILSFEFGYLEFILKAFMQRRAEEDSYQMILKMDPVGEGEESGLDDLIVTLSRHVTARRKLRDTGELDDRLREYYARLLKCEPDKVDLERAAAQEDVAILRLREDLRMALERGVALGEPYNFKQAEGDAMKRDVDHYRKTLPLVDSVVAASVTRQAKPKSAAAKPAEQETEARIDEQSLSEGEGQFPFM